MTEAPSDNLSVPIHFDDASQCYDAVSLGMWIFLATEVMFFGGLFTAYIVYRMRNPAAFAEAGHHLYMWLGAINTAVLLTSSWTMALAVHAAKHADRRAAARKLFLTAGLGGLFLLIKAVEYYLDAREHLVPGDAFRIGWTQPAASVQLFFILYFVMTGLHAVHMLVGVGVMLTLAARATFSRRPVRSLANAVDMAGLYWHFVDIVWIFLFPLLYLVA